MTRFVCGTLQNANHFICCALSWFRSCSWWQQTTAAAAKVKDSSNSNNNVKKKKEFTIQLNTQHLEKQQLLMTKDGNNPSSTF